MVKAIDYCKTVFDGTHDTPKPTNSGYKLLTSKNILNGYIDKDSAYYISELDYKKINERSQVKKWDILFSMIGTVGNVCLVTEDNIDFAIKNMGVFSCDDEYKSKWLYFYLKSPYAQKLIENYLNGAIQKFLPLHRLRDFPIPEFNENSKKICDFLWNLEKLQLNNRKIIFMAEELINEIYNHWFLQYEFPYHGKSYISNNGKMVFNAKTNIAIPENWDVYNLSDCISKEKNAIVDGPFGTQMKIEEYVSKGIPIYEMENLNNRFIINSPTHFITENKFNEIKRSAVKNGDIIISKTGTLGLLGIKDDEYEKGIIVSRLAKITPNPHRMGKYTLLTILKKVNESGYWLKKSSGSTMPILNNSLVSNLELILPKDSELLIKFENYVTPFYERIKSAQIENQKIEKFENNILPLMYTNKIKF